MINLQDFCRDDFKGLDRPRRYDGSLYAANGHIAVRVPDDPSVECVAEEGPIKKEGFLKVFETPETQDFAPLSVQLPKGPCCPICKGGGKMTRCDECNGEGEVAIGRHEYVCKGCGGDGFVPGDGEACPHCRGAGIDTEKRVAIGHTGFKYRYLALLLSLPGIEFALPVSPEGCARFRFAGGDGVLMPMRG